jgi:glycosyltransferase involved in cell wall biosynthesis
MNFWFRNLILGCLLVALAWAFFANQDFLLSLDGSLAKKNNSATPVKNTSPAESPSETKNNVLEGEKYQQGRNSPNAAAAGLSKFYANLHGDKTGKGPKIRNNIVYLPDPKGDLTELLQAREMVVRPYKKNWQGSIQSRPFRRGETLNQKLTEFTKKDGIELIWWLNRDYVVKDPFRIEKDILTTTFIVSKSVEGHFASGLSIFFCNKQRTLIVIESGTNSFLAQDCILLSGNSNY